MLPFNKHMFLQLLVVFIHLIITSLNSSEAMAVVWPPSFATLWR